MQAFRRNAYSSVIFRLADRHTFESVQLRINKDPRLTLTLQKIRLFGELTQLSKPPGNATVPPGPLDWLTY